MKSIRGEIPMEISKFYWKTGSHGRKSPIKFRFAKILLLRFDHWRLIPSSISPLSTCSPSLVPLLNYFDKPPFRRDWILIFSPRIILVRTNRISFLRISFHHLFRWQTYGGRERIKKSKKRKSDSVRVAGMERERGSRLRNLLARDCRLNCQVKTQHLSTCTGAHREPPDWYLER